MANQRASHQSLGLFYMRMSEQELAVEIGEINGIQIYHVDLSKASTDQVFEQFASNATSTDHEDARLQFD